MRKLVEIRNADGDRVCDFVREEDNSLCYHVKCSDRKGHAKVLVINISDLIYPALLNMTETERRTTIKQMMAVS